MRGDAVPQAAEQRDALPPDLHRSDFLFERVLVCPALLRTGGGRDPGCQVAFNLAESQNHRMFGVGRDLCGSSSPTPC